MFFHSVDPEYFRKYLSVQPPQSQTAPNALGEPRFLERRGCVYLAEIVKASKGDAFSSVCSHPEDPLVKDT